MGRVLRGGESRAQLRDYSPVVATTTAAAERTRSGAFRKVNPLYASRAAASTGQKTCGTDGISRTRTSDVLWIGCSRAVLHLRSFSSCRSASIIDLNRRW